MPINESDDAYALLASSESDAMDNDPLMPNGIPPPNFQEDSPAESPDQQPGIHQSLSSCNHDFPVGAVVSHKSGDKSTVSIVDKVFKTAAGTNATKSVPLTPQSHLL